MKAKLNNFYKHYIKVNIKEISLMGLLLAFFTIIKYISYVIFTGPLNFSIEIIFWILIGFIFGPIKGPLFSFLCDTIITLFTSGIIYWMIEYALIAPLISFFSWFFFNYYKENRKYILIISICSLLLSNVGSILVFTYQLNVLNNFKYEGIKNIYPSIAYALIILLNVSIFSFTLFCLISFYYKKEWKYIKWLYFFAIIVLIVIIFRWLWGPYAFIAFSNRFFSKNYDVAKQYPLLLSGIVMKSCLTIPCGTAILLPFINIIDIHRKYEIISNKY